jgi:eukaryotic-like serine/threonine-protein kinase
MGMTSREEEQRLQLEHLVGNKYEVLCKLGGGGMAQVLLARHRLHGGLFAIKILSDQLSQDPTIVSRFKQEATTAASLSGHPNIVPIFDIGEGNGIHYLIMQFVSGEDMASFLRREGKLALAPAAGVIAQAAEGLVWAESKRIVHRDLKPGNLQLDTAGRVHILDFGISKIVDIADGLTRPGESLGTPYYMSPEQIRGEGCDTRSDLYSLGVIFFELLSGRRPFENESVTAIQIAHLSTPAPSLLDLDSDLPPMCEEIVQKLLRKDRNERYQSPQELLNDLYKYGASSGPTILRPVVAPGLQAQIDRAQSLPTNGANEVIHQSPSAPTQLPLAAATDILPNHTAVATVVVETPIASTPAKPVRQSRRLAIILGSLAILLIAAVVIVLYPRKKPLAPVLDDSHGQMVLVPAGKFIFGDKSPDSPHPQESISLPDFYIDRTEVSNAEYVPFEEATHRSFSGEAYAIAHPDEPVTNVSEADAAAYAAWAGKRLPTEQEWEKAARGTDGRPYPWGSDPWTQDVPEQLQPVNSFPDRKSPYGSLNMAGNAWEWTATHYMPEDREIADMRNSLKSDSFSKTWFSLKGGSFSPNGNRGFRVYLIRGFPEDQTSPLVGFRCVKDASAVSQ